MMKLNYIDLLKMEGQQVIVEDNINNFYNQICVVKINCRNKTICLSNEDYDFEYDENGNCIDGEFEVFMIK